MNVFDKILVCIFLLAIIIWQALHQAKIFKEKKTISHFWKSVWYAGAVALVTIPYIWLYDWWYLIKVPILGVLERMAFFDFILNLARSKSLFYNGDKSTGSLIDRLENKLSEDAIPAWKMSWVLYFVFWIFLIK